MRTAVPYPAWVSVSATADFDPILYARSACEPSCDACQPNELACDDATGPISALNFDWAGGDLFLFVDGYGNLSGDFRLRLSAQYPLLGQCGPEVHDYASCEPGTLCAPDPAAGFPTCQAF